MANDSDRWWEAPGMSGETPQTGADPYSQPAIPQQPGGYPPPQYGAPQPGYGQPPYGQQPYAPQPYGQQPYAQQPYGYAPQPNPGPPRRNNGAGVIIAVVVVVALIAVVVIAAVVIGASSSDDTSAAATSTTATTVKAGPLTGATTAPATPGSKGVLVASYRVAYDVPSAWSVSAEYDTMSFTTALGSMNGRGQATEGESYCPGSAYRAMAGVTTTTESDPASAAKAVAKIAAAGGYSDPTGGKLTSPTALTTQSGVTGQFVESTGPWKPAIAGCTADSYSVYTFAFKNAADTLLVLTLLVDRNATGELTADQAKKIITSLRLV
ncbi:hypothetical protein ACFU44_18195 [Nocardia rhizosphaerihabitans]|uniref:hypothetical protein n=1 Tax=Nocardia rhizosphaerihabitans TaxID=1691570 RepID=UPI00366CC9EC